MYVVGCVGCGCGVCGGARIGMGACGWTGLVWGVRWGLKCPCGGLPHTCPPSTAHSRQQQAEGPWDTHDPQQVDPPAVHGSSQVLEAAYGGTE